LIDTRVALGLIRSAHGNDVAKVVEDVLAARGTESSTACLVTCDSCKHFGEPDPLHAWVELEDDDEERASGHHECLRVLHGNAGGRETFERFEQPAVVVDGSGYVARLRVLPTFGCVLWESKS
jgi:hypothetical protein